jgi:hypothetical protein
MRQLLAGLAESDGLPDPDWWGSALMLLIDGANARVITTGETTAIIDARRTATALIAAADALPLNTKEDT